MPKFSLFALSLALLSGSVFSEASGLIPVTPKELRFMQKKLGMRRIKAIRPNSLGLSRINTVLAKRGQPTHASFEAINDGTDTLVDPIKDYDFENMGVLDVQNSEVLANALPKAVDNSTLRSFPSIGEQSHHSDIAWAAGYYQLSHNLAQTIGKPVSKCSPKFIYSMVNGGSDAGSRWADNFRMIQGHGCASLAEVPEDGDSRSWSPHPEHWKRALSYRSLPVQFISGVDAKSGLSQMKQLLTNGYVLTFGSYIDSWQYTKIKNGKLAGKKVVTHVNGAKTSHAMTIVGFDDDAWVDLNRNNVLDHGESGVLKVANSWGKKWGHSGYMYIAYDALRKTSAVAGVLPTNRHEAFQSSLVFHLPVKSTAEGIYQPKYLARFSLSHQERNQLSISIGWSSSKDTTATHSLAPFAFANKGGARAVSGTFVMDISELPLHESDSKIYLTVKDNKAGSPTKLSNFEIIDTKTGNTVAAKRGKMKVDGKYQTRLLGHISN